MWQIWQVWPVDYKILTSRFGLKPVDFFRHGRSMFYDKKSLKDCHKLCIIYIIFSPDPDKEIWDSSEGDWGLR